MIRRFALATMLLAVAACGVPASNDAGHTAPTHGHSAHQHASGAVAAATYIPGENIRVETLPTASASTVIDVADGQTIRLDPTMVRRNIIGTDVFQYGYNGQIPGPTIRVRQGTTFTVDVTNRIDQPTTVHWHGIRYPLKR